MPEMLFDVMWPDDSLDRCYSPSTVIQKHVRTDTSYALEELLENLRAGLTEAGERISQRFGHYCSGARDQLARLEAKSARFAPQEQVRILGLYRRGGARPLEAVLADEQQRRQSLLDGADLPIAAE
ncbi:MAG: MSMEG_0570 family nitrogen starvation response protein [Myxococcales bacterium]|jgi:uncharacterized repeat protein (TIGR04042 family)